ncbi:hypothetical protein D3C81_1927830 [compost metagenome]
MNIGIMRDDLDDTRYLLFGKRDIQEYFDTLFDQFVCLSHDIEPDTHTEEYIDPVPVGEVDDCQ